MQVKLLTALSFLVIFVGSIGAVPITPVQNSPQEVTVPEYSPGRLIVKFKEGTVQSSSVAASLVSGQGASTSAAQAVSFVKPAAFAGVQKKYGFQDMHRLFPVEGLTVGIQRSLTSNTPTVVDPFKNVYVIDINAQADVRRAVRDYQDNPNVEFAQPDYMAKSSLTTSATTIENLQWPLTLIGAPAAWEVSKGAGTIVAIIETGVDINHPDLLPNLWRNPNETINGIDDDGNGYVDDVHGWNFINNNGDVTGLTGYGTNAAGIVAAVGNNTYGVIGVAPLAKVMPIKALGDNTFGPMSALAQAIVYAADQGADVIYNGWYCTYGCPLNPVVEEAVRYAAYKGKVVVFAAGHDSRDVVDYSPQNMPEVISVPASDSADQAAYFTNVGDKNSVFAPGIGIFSTWNGYSYMACNGTSQSAAHVSAVAALLRSKYPGMPGGIIKSIIEDSADLIPGLGGKGRLNAQRALSVSPAPVYLTQSDFIEVRGNNDSLIQSGETGGVQVKVQAANVDVSNVTVALSSNDPRVTFGVRSTRFDLVRAGQGVSNDTAPLTFSVSPDCTPGSLIQFTLTLTAGTYTRAKLISLEVAPVADPRLRVVEKSLSEGYWPKISGERIAWMNNPDNNDEIYMYDLANNTRLQVTDSMDYQMNPDISGNYIVWDDYTYGAPLIALYDISRGFSRFLPTDNSYNRIPRISGNNIIYEGTNEDAQLYWYSLSSNEEMQITDRGAVDWDVSGNNVVWVATADSGVGYSVYRVDLRYADFSTLYTSTGALNSLAIDGNKVVWMDKANGSEVIIYDLQTRSITKIPANVSGVFAQVNPSVSGNLVVWQDQSDVDDDVYVYDIDAGTKKRLSFNPGHQIIPDISGKKVSWLSMRFTPSGFLLYDLYVYDLNTVVGNININSGALYTNSPSVSLDLTATGTLPITHMRLSNDGRNWFTSEAYKAAKLWSLSAGDGVKLVAVQYMQQDGKWSSISTKSIILDATAPVGGVAINSGAYSTENRAVVLNPYASDSGSGMGAGAQMQISEDDTFPGASWEPYATEKPWILSAGGGLKTVYIRFKDALGNCSTVYSGDIELIAVKHRISPQRVTLNSGETAYMTFGVPPEAVGTKLIVSCSPGMTVSLGSIANICNRWQTLMLPANTDVAMQFRVTSRVKTEVKAVPSFYYFTAARPNYLNGVSGEITVPAKQ
ncbi:MAG: S8 family serine peptidase [Candidatus Omnitrophica bacterium]|nr:S8 family serine peptidase [Candidatus Omnitrophota bacterium]